MNIHHDTFFKSILEDDSISSAFKAHIHCCLSKGARLWLIVKPFIHSFLARFIFTLVLHFRFETSTLFTCECGHGLNTYGTYLAPCPFGGQHITTHYAIKDIMYVLALESGHIV
jgi:hypothetical protein